MFFQCGLLIFVLNILKVQGDIYKYHQENKIWNEARKICESEGTTLAMPSNEKEVEELVNFFGSQHQFIHVGFHNFFADRNKYAYFALTGQPWQNYFSELWQSNEPSYTNDKKCLLLGNNKKIYIASCVWKLPFVCQSKNMTIKQSDENCDTADNEYRYGGEGIDKCFKIHMDPLGFSSAEAVCRSEGGNLAIIRNKVEETFLKKMFNETKYTSSVAKWNFIAAIGVHHLFQDGHYMTVLNEPATYLNWAPGRPNAPNVERCVSMNKNGQLDDYPCHVPCYFICEVPKKGNIDIRFDRGNLV